MRTAFFSLALALLAGCAGGGTPCTTSCPDVSGTYQATTTPLTSSMSGCALLSYSGTSGTLYVSQQGSALTLTSDEMSASATLYSDLLVSGNAQLTVDSGATATVTLNGSFSSSASARHLDLTLMVTAVLDEVSCTGTTTMSAFRTGP